MDLEVWEVEVTAPERRLVHGAILNPVVSEAVVMPEVEMRHFLVVALAS
jgi:hypothetical protein